MHLFITVMLVNSGLLLLLMDGAVGHVSAFYSVAIYFISHTIYIIYMYTYEDEDELC